MSLGREKDTHESEAVTGVASHEQGGGKEDHLEGGRGEMGFPATLYHLYIVRPYPAYPARAEWGPFRPEGVLEDFNDTHFTEKLRDFERMVLSGEKVRDLWRGVSKRRRRGPTLLMRFGEVSPIWMDSPYWTRISPHPF